MTHSRLVPVILALALIAGGGLRVAGIMGKKTIGLDEGISLLAATGHEGTYQNVITGETRPYGTPVPAAEWKQFIRPDRTFCFKVIGDDLADYDVHPPLYFWILHIWFLIFGATIISGPILNVLFFLLSLFALFFLARDCLKNPLEAALVTLAWSISPAVIQVCWISRSYGLLILCVILLVHRAYLLSFHENPSAWWNYFCLMLITAAGLLTHYSFLFPLSGTVLFLLYKLYRQPRRLFTGLLTIVGGGLVTVLLHPHYYRSFFRQQSQAQYNPYGSFSFRIQRLFSGFLDFFIGNREIQRGILAVLFIIIIWLAIVYILRRLGETRDGKNLNLAGISILYFLCWTLSLITILYLSGVNSMQQMGRRYLSIIYPFLAFVPVLFFRLLGRVKTLITICFFFFLFFSAGMRVYRFRKAGERFMEHQILPQNSDFIVIDTAARSFIPRLLSHIPDDVFLFIADQEYLLQHQERWLNNQNDSFIYISTYYNIYHTGRERIIETIRRDRKIKPVDGRILGNGIAYRVSCFSDEK